MNALEMEIKGMYDKVRHGVGRDYSRAFVPSEISRRLVEAFTAKYSIPLPPDYFLPACYVENVQLYPDAEDFLLQLGLDESGYTFFLTRGEVREKKVEEENVGFQNWKIEHSDILPLLGAHALQKLRGQNVPFVNGGYDKASEDVLKRIFSMAQALQLPLHYFDDAPNELQLVGEYGDSFGLPPHLYWVNRTDEPLPPGITVPVQIINNFTEIDAKQLQGSIVGLDYDGTVGVRPAMSEQLCQRLVGAAMQLFQDR